MCLNITTLHTYTRPHHQQQRQHLPHVIYTSPLALPLPVLPFTHILTHCLSPSPPLCLPTPLTSSVSSCHPPTSHSLLFYPQLLLISLHFHYTKHQQLYYCFCCCCPIWPTSIASFVTFGFVVVGCCYCTGWSICSLSK